MQERSLDDAGTSRSRTEGIVIGEEMSSRAKIINTLVLVLLLFVAVSFVWLMSSLPHIEGKIPVANLQKPVTVARDHYGVPRITARSARDAYFSLGYVHAQDRLWQMEMQRRVGAGRLAELVGEAGLPNDRFMRTLGLYRLAEQGIERLDKPTRDALLAYADGVNSYIESHRHRLPLEFRMLGVKPEPWAPADSLVWGRLMALQLTGNWRDEVLMARLAGRMEPDRINELFPAYPSDAPATLDAATAAGLLEMLPANAAPRLASNVWAVAGDWTSTGKPLLANDPHLGFQAPIQWYLASIEAPGLAIAGATIPGVPFHLIGHNASIAWGTTTTHADTVDLFVTPLSGEDAYLTPNGPLPFTRRDEVIRVQGLPDVVISVRETVNGPVVSDLLARSLASEGNVLAFRATALEPDDLTAQGFYKMNRAMDWDGFQEAMADFHAPVQNFAFADTAGTIAFITGGRVPLRVGGADGALPADASTRTGAWIGWIPPRSMPQIVNPGSGRVVNANNKVGGAHSLSWSWPEGYRAQRIEDLLAGRTDLSSANMVQMQADHLSLAAVEMLRLIGAVESKDSLVREALTLLAGWDGSMAQDRPEPLIFSAWMDQVWHDLFAEKLGEDFHSFRTIRPYVLRNVLVNANHWCGPAGCEALVRGALERSVRDVAGRRGGNPAKWRWGDEHQAVFAHAVLRHLPVLGWFSTITVPTDGDDSTVNRGTFAPGGFEHVHGAGLRVVYDLADLSQSRFVMPTGQSGNILSRHYNDLTPRWAANDGLILSGAPPDGAVLQLEPVN